MDPWRGLNGLVVWRWDEDAGVFEEEVGMAALVL